LRRVAALALLAALAVAWAIPGPVDALVARQEPILLGRYAVGHFAGLATATVAVGLVAALLWSRRSLAEAAGLVALVALSTWAGIAAIAALARETIEPRYVVTPVASAVSDPALRARLHGRVVTRQPDFHWDVVREDHPVPGRSYPRRVAGYPSRAIVLTTDDRGLRNAPRGGRYDVVVAGDSFTEGSMVSDGEPWWAQLARATDRRIYNTGVSGLSIEEYLNNWIAFGLDGGASTLVVMIYEGNDWKPLAPPPPERAGFFDVALGDSPLRWRAELALVQLLAPIGADRPPPPSPGLAWMPIEIDAGGASHAYAFEPKHLMRLDWDPAAFAAAPEWTTNERVLRELVAIARERGVRVVFAYAPSKPHVLMPLVRDRVTAEQLDAFARFRDRDDPLPDPAALRDRLFARLDTQEHAIAAWCAAQGVAFVSLTEPLRNAVGQGVPVYFTYDPHWTEEGHAVAARVLQPVIAADAP
jgi:hypothetical protein